MSTTALITGASSGIGKATAQAFASFGMRLILCGRRIDRLEKLATELSTKTEVTLLYFDVRSKQSVYKAIESLPQNFREIDILVNNAGNAHGLASIQEGDDEDWDKMIDANVKGLLYVSKAVIPNMVARKKGHIVNIGSIAGKEVYVNGNVYCASKHAVDALTKGMRLDLVAHNIKVTSINPGLVETEFSLVRFKGNVQRAAKIYEGIEPLRAEDVAETILFSVTRPSNVMIADVTLLASAQASATVVHRN
jgi:3-hydroxy acid dehydrogenase / malonic semialdehyde reductase